jgi:hypothetical protein
MSDAAVQNFSLLGPERWRTTAVVISFLALSTVIVLNDSKTGDLSRWYTDHLHHNFATWVFLHKGLAIYQEPFAVAWQGVSYPHPAYTWEQNPGMVYPPGVFAVFLPTTLLGAWLPMERVTFAKLNVVVMLFWAHLALWAVMRALKEQTPGARSVILAIAWMYLARLGLEGFWDSTWIAAGAWMVWAMSRNKPEQALVAFCVAAMLHFRAAVLAPLGLWALWQAVGGKPVRDWPWKVLGLCAVSMVLSLGSFALMYPVTGRFRGNTLPLIQTLGSHFWIIVGVTAVTAGIAWRWADPITALTACVAGTLGLIHVNYWWHGQVLLFAPLAVDVARRARHPSAARALLLSWLFCVQPLAWRDHAGQVFTDLADNFRWPSSPAGSNSGP